jgi:uncharacterized protein YgbK (DUF1537 family)
LKTIVLDDDPTGTQCATHVTVLLEWDVDAIVKVLSEADSVYLQTNSRALDEKSAVALAQRVKIEGLAAGKALNERVDFVLRGDSTLRGHVFSETEVFLNTDTAIIFLPAYPDVGRTTKDGIHFVKIEGINKRADETEFARDPVFPFTTSTMADFVKEKSGRIGIHIGLDLVRGDLKGLISAFAQAPAGSVIVPDALNDEDISKIAQAIEELRKGDNPLVVRSAAPLAALLAGVRSQDFLAAPLRRGTFNTLLVAGSHTEGATKQLAEIALRWGEPQVINTEVAFLDPRRAANSVIESAKTELETKHLALITSERNRKSEHNTLAHGEMVMKSIIAAAQGLLSYVDVVVSKGGITSAEVARSGIGATSAWVLGQILPGISVWEMESREGRIITYVVVPGNVGNSDTLIKVLEIVGLN